MMIILELLELQVLAAARGMESYYGLSAGRTYRQEEIYSAVHQLLQSGILEKKEDHLEVQSPVSEYLDWMREGTKVLVIDRQGQRYPRQCLYQARGRYLCLECSTTDEARIFLYEIPGEELWEELRNTGQLPEEKLTEDIGDFDFQACWEQHMDSSTRTALGPGLEAGADILSGCPQVYSVFSLHDNRTGEPEGRLVLLDLSPEYCMVLQEKGKAPCRMRYGSREAMERIKSWWRDES